MNILLVHNYYQQPGGEDVAYESEAALLESHNHRVTRYQLHNDAVNGLTRLQAAAAAVWNRKSYDDIRQLVRRHAIDIAHFHNTFPLISPAAYYAARREGAATVQTLHNYRFLCPSSTFYRQGASCELCLGRAIPWPAIRYACYRESRAASGVVSAMLTTHRLLRTYRRAVSAYIVLTEFARQKCIAGGLPSEKLFLKPNFLLDDPGCGTGEGAFALFIGRLAPEKGIQTLLDAWRQLNGIKLRICGDGPLAPLVSAEAGRNPNIEWLGRVDRTRVGTLLAQARFLVFPSEWYEGLPFVIIEAFAKGTPVIASAMGAMPSLVVAGKTGLTFQPGCSAELCARVRDLWTNPCATSMRQAARQEFESKYTSEANYQQTLEIYRRALQLSPKARHFAPARSQPEAGRSGLSQ